MLNNTLHSISNAKALAMKKSVFIFPLLLVLSEMASYLSNDMYLPALPQIMREFHITQYQVQLTLSSWFLGSASMQLFVGPLSDRFGRRPIFILGMILFVISTFGCAIASNIYLLIFSRFVQGSVLCFVIVAGYATIHELYDQAHAIRILALMSSIAVLAPAFGPFLGSLILNIANWRWNFWFLLILGIILLGLHIKWMPEPLSADSRHSLHIRHVLSQYRKIITNRGFLTFTLAFCFIFCGFIAWIAAGPFYVIDQFSYNPSAFGFSQILIFACFISSTQLVKYLMEKIGVNKLIQCGLVITLCGSIIAFCLAIVRPNFLGGLVIGMMIFSFGSGFTFAPLQRLAIEASNEPMGSRMAILSTFISGSGLLASILVSIFYNGKLISFAYFLMMTSLLAGLIYAVGKKFHCVKSST